MSEIEFYLEVTRRYPYRLLLVTLLTVFSGAIEALGILAAFPLLVQVFEGVGKIEGPIGLLLESLNLYQLPVSTILIIIVAFLVLARGMLFISRVVVERIGVDIQIEFKGMLHTAVLAADWPFNLEQKAGYISNAITSEAQKSGFAVMFFARVLSNGVLLAVYLVVGFLLAWPTMIMAVVFGLILVPVMNWFNNWTRRLSEKRLETNNLANSAVIENMANAKFIKSSGLEQVQDNKFQLLLKTLRRVLFYEAVARQSVAQIPLITAILFVGLLLGLNNLLNWQPITNLLFFIAFINRAAGQFTAVQADRQKVALHMPSYAFVRDLLRDSRQHAEKQGGRAFQKLARQIKLDNVGFRYSGSRPNLLSGINIIIERNTTTAFVGESGAGKTTLVDLIIGLIRPGTGTVLVDGIDLQEYSIHAWRSRIGYVPQEPILFNGSIKDNITVGCEDVSDQVVETAAKMVSAHEFIMDQADGYDTLVGDRGIRLSGGQRQRITLARALVRNPALLVLDEATSALDNQSEQKIQEAIARLQGSMTILVIAHRLSTVENADIIYVMKDGRVVESGNFAELRARRGEFSKLYNLAATSQPVS
jgi:ABC-type multidrug transport system fused ATPase/permease subunit